MSDPNPVVVDPAPELLPLAERIPPASTGRTPGRSRSTSTSYDPGGPRPGGHQARAGPLLHRHRATGDAASGRVPDRLAGPTGRGRDGKRSRACPAGFEPRAERVAAAREALPPNATPIPKEQLVPGRLELTVKFSDLPQPLPVQDGLKIGVQTGRGDRHRDPAGQGLAHAGTGGADVSPMGGRAERVAGSVRGRGDRPQAPGLAGVREESPVRGRTGGDIDTGANAETAGGESRRGESARGVRFESKHRECNLEPQGENHENRLNPNGGLRRENFRVRL